MAPPRVLICGAGIGGPVAAFWLSRAGCEVTVIEKAPQLRSNGQGIDIRSPATDILRHMDVYDAIKAKSTKEAGLVFVDGDNNARASFPMNSDKNAASFTQEIEIMRGDAAQILAAAVKGKVTFLFGKEVERLEENTTGVAVTFKNESQVHQYDIVVGADGLGSNTRALMLGTAIDDKSFFKPWNQFVAFFSIPRQPQDGDISRWYNAPGRRCALVRPINAERTSATICIMPPNPDTFVAEAIKQDTPTQKRKMREAFADAGWEIPRLLDGMDADPTFYVQSAAMIQLLHWSSEGGRITLVGDAAYAVGGFGTTLAITGAYLLAGEVANAIRQHPDDDIDWVHVTSEYERHMRPLVKKSQTLPPGTPWILNPETQWGITFMNTVLRLIAWSGITKFLGRFSNQQGQTWKLPSYDF